MKKILILFISLFIYFFTLPLYAEEAVLEATCVKGGEFGNQVVIKLSRNYRYGKLIIKRTNANADHSRDLTSFQGGNYRLDLSSHGGITGYVLEYSPKDGTTMTTTSGTLTCGDASPSSTEVPQTDPTTMKVPSTETPSTEAPPAEPPAIETPEPSQDPLSTPESNPVEDNEGY